MTTEQAVQSFLQSRRSRLLSTHTINTYAWALSKMQRQFPQTLPTTPKDLQTVFIANSDLAPDSIAGLWRKLRTFWRWLEDEGLGQNIMEKVPAPPARIKLPRTLSEVEAGHLLAAAENDRDYAVLALLLDTGMRVGELASLKRTSVTDVGFHVTGKTGDRMVPVSPAILDLTIGQAAGDDLWMSINNKGPLTISGLQQIVRRTMRDAGFRPPKLGPHTLRHTFAVQYLLNGGDFSTLQQILGHTKVQSTMRYASMNIGLVVQQHHKFSPMATLFRSPADLPKCRRNQQQTLTTGSS